MKFRFSGHESFPCRYTWLPKAYQAILENPEIFSEDNLAMVRLGVGKNMVKAIRFWVQAFGVAILTANKKSLEITPFGHHIFDIDGLDPFLEDSQTLWLLHWKVSTILEDPLFAWYFLLNNWPDPSFSRSEVISSFTRESERMNRPLSDFTKEQHFDIFLHTYVPARSKKNSEVLEDSLDCPLTELHFILPAGERIVSESGKREPLYEFTKQANNEISPDLFIYCLFDFWQNNRSLESTVSFQDLSSLPGSIGQVFKLNESEIRSRLDSLESDSNGLFRFAASAAVPRIIRQENFDTLTQGLLLQRIYGMNVLNNVLQAENNELHAD